MASSNQWSNWNSTPDIPYSPMIPNDLGPLPSGATDDSGHSPMDLDVPGPSSLLFSPINPSEPPESSLFPDSSNALTQESPPKHDAAWARAEYLAGRLTTSKDNSSDVVSLVCPRCGTWINSGQTNRDEQPLGTRFFTALGQHMKGVKCEKRRCEKLTRDDDMDSSHAESPISIRDQSLPPISPALSRRSSSVSLSPYLTRRPSLSINTASPAPSFSIPSTPVTPASGTHFRFSTPGSEQNELGDPCPGLAFDWNIDDKPFYQTFPVQRIGSEPDSLPFWYQGRGSQMELHFAISKKCTHFARSDPFGLRPCDLCEGLKPNIDRLRELANNADHNIGYQYLNWDQLHTRLDEKRDEIKGLKFKMLNMGRSLASTARKLVDCRAFIMAVAENDVPRLNALVSTCIRSGAGVKTMTEKIAQAFAGNYSPKVFTPKDMELSLLVLRLGGRPLLHALNHALNLPSVRTLYRHMKFTRIMPTIGHITSNEIEHNLREVLMKDRASTSPPPPLRGVSILIDETVLEEQASHFKHSNSVGGLCWLHTTSFQLVLRSYQSALFLAQGIGLGTFHLAKEVTVAAVSLFGESRSYPILAAPTCKKETADDTVSQMQLIINAFNRIARDTVGAIWSFATDGDAIRRAAGYTMFVKTMLSEDSPLWNILGALRKLGFNLFTGDFDITLDFDFKHLLKRWSTLLRSTAGILLNNGCVINRMVLSRYLLRLPYHTPESVQQLLYPSDAQNVPCTIDLFMSIIDLRNLPCISDDPSEIATMDALKLLAEILESLLDPFFNPERSLQEQVTSLAKYSHLTFVLFRKYQTSFMPNQLYGDSQTMVKNAYFCIAKQQLLDGKSPFYLFDLGDDKLEKLFGRIRMLGGHCSGMNYRQAIERLGQATGIDAVFEREPDWDPGFRRLKMTQTAHLDHLNAKAWKGDVIADHCDLAMGWISGRIAAETYYKTTSVSPADYDFPSLFALPTVDVLRPHGGDKYPGVDNSVPDRSMDESVPSSATDSDMSTSPAADTTPLEDDDFMLFEDGLEEPQQLSLPAN